MADLLEEFPFLLELEIALLFLLGKVLTHLSQVILQKLLICSSATELNLFPETLQFSCFIRREGTLLTAGVSRALVAGALHLRVGVRLVMVSIVSRGRSAVVSDRWSHDREGHRASLTFASKG